MRIFLKSIVGYAQISKAVDLPQDDREGLITCLKALREDDVVRLEASG